MLYGGISCYLVHCIVLYSSIYIAPLNSRGPTEAFFDSTSSKKRDKL